MIHQLAAALFGAALAGEPAALCASDRISLLTGSGPVAYSIEIADEPEEHARGLMFRTSLARDAGMLFLFPAPAPRSFWMRNTPLPLDIIFIDETGRVLNIAARTTPYSERPIPSAGEAMAVLEINGGEAAARGIEPGAQAIHPAFTAAPDPHRCPE